MTEEAQIISLNRTEEDRMIDLWEEARCLWDPRSQGYKNRDVKREACLDIARQMEHPEWRAEQVLKKISSMRGSYNNCKRRLKSGRKTGSAVGETPTKIWHHYYRVQSFLGGVQYRPSDSQSNLMLVDEDSINNANIKTNDEDGNWDTINNTEFVDGAPDLQLLLSQVESSGQTVALTPHPLQAQTNSNPMYQASTNTLTPQKRPAKDDNKHVTPKKCLSRQKPTTTSSPDKLELAVTQMTKALIEKKQERKDQKNNEYFVFGQYVSERLSKIKSKKTALVLQQKIDQLINTALIEEMSD